MNIINLPFLHCCNTILFTNAVHTLGHICGTNRPTIDFTKYTDNLRRAGSILQCTRCKLAKICFKCFCNDWVELGNSYRILENEKCKDIVNDLKSAPSIA